MSTCQAAVLEGIAVLAPSPSPIEVRLIGRDAVAGGYFDDRNALIATLCRYDGRCAAYITAHQLRSEIQTRVTNRVGRPHRGTRKEDVASYQWLIVDLDPVRRDAEGALLSSASPATDGEHTAAWHRAREVRAWIVSEGVPADAIVLADSGNGSYALVRVALAATPASERLVARILAVIAWRFDDPAVVVDQCVKDPNRIIRALGTLNTKGSATADRPHRHSRVLDAPTLLASCPESALHRLATLAPAQVGQADTPFPAVSTIAAPREVAKSRAWLEVWLPAVAPAIAHQGPWGAGWRYVFSVCPWRSTEHTNRAAFVVVTPSGAIAAGCHHNGCADKTWRDLRDLLTPGWDLRRPRRDR